MRALCLLFAALAAGSAFLEAAPLKRRAPGFSLPDSNYKQYDLQDYRGKIVLIDLMRTNCPHCKVFSQILEKAKAKYGDRIAVLAVVHPPDNPQTIKAYAVENKVSSPILFDCGQMAISYLRATPQKMTVDLPHLFIVDREGYIVGDYGYKPANQAIFEGGGLFPILDGIVGPARKSK